MPYIFGKLWHLAIIWPIRKAFQCILQGVRILLAKYTRISPTSDNESYIISMLPRYTSQCNTCCHIAETIHRRFSQMCATFWQDVTSRPCFFPAPIKGDTVLKKIIHLEEDDQLSEHHLEHLPRHAESKWNWRTRLGCAAVQIFRRKVFLELERDKICPGQG